MSITLDVGVVHLGHESDLRRLEGVVIGEIDFNDELAFSVGRVLL